MLLQLSLFIHHAVDTGQENGAATVFAARIGVHKSLLSKLKGEGPSGRDMSDTMARQIEHALNLPKGWMDEPHEDAPPTPAEQSLMTLALEASRAADAKGRTELRRLLKAIVSGAQVPRLAAQTGDDNE